MPRRTVLVIGTVGLIVLSACGVVATHQAGSGGVQEIVAPASGPADGTSSSRQGPGGVGPTDKNTAEQGRAPVALSPGGTIATPSTGRLPAPSGGGAETYAGNLSGGECSSAPFLHCYKK